MDWNKLGEMLHEPLTQLVVLAVVLSYYVLCYTTRIASGNRRVRKQGKTWSWKQFWSDIADRLQAIFVFVGLIIGSDMTQWLAPLIGVTLDEAVSSALNSALIIAIPFVAGLAELYAAARNTMKLWGWQKNILALNMDENKQNYTTENYDKIANTVYEFIDTITPKTAKEDFEETLKSDGKVVDVLDYEEVEPGKGGITNTYPNVPQPYRTAPQDSITDPSSCWNRECVSYCAAKIFELTGKWPTRTGGMSARYWVQRLAENGYTKIVDRPVNGGKYVGVSDKGQYGHVLWFEEGSTISEYNYLYRGGFSARNIDLSAYKWVEIKAPSTPATPAVPDKKPTKKDPTIYYTYKQGDTFGQVITDLGLKSKYGLWDPVNGDVAYYTNQLREQGITGNIPVGTVIKLTPRK